VSERAHKVRLDPFLKLRVPSAAFLPGQPMFSHRSRRFWCLIVLAGAFVLRAVAAFGLQSYLDRNGPRLCVIAGDAEGYWELAQKLAAGDEFSIYDPPRRVLRMPGFPLFLAVAMKMTGGNHLAIRLLLAGVGTGACGLVYWLGRELFDHDIGLLAAAMAAVSPTLIVFSVMFLSETLFAAALVACLIAFAKLTRSLSSPLGGDVPGVRGAPTASTTAHSRILSPDGRRENQILMALAAGLLAAIATYVRPTWLLVGPAFAVWLGLRRGRNGWWHGALLIASLAVCLSPWVIRNYLATGHAVVTTLWVGPSLYDGLHPGASGDSDMSFVERDGVYDRMSEFDADQHYRREAWRFVRDQPGRVLQLGMVKLGRYLSPVPNAAQFKSQAAWIAVLLSFALIPVPALVGWWHARHDVSRWLLPLAPLVYFGGVHTVFVGSLRYRLPAEYPLAVLAAVGVNWLWKSRGSWFFSDLCRSNLWLLNSCERFATRSSG
jgi:4-amino-4-deoxy-L-arabinose transferase-like glycosyltransferase